MTSHLASPTYYALLFTISQFVLDNLNLPTASFTSLLLRFPKLFSSKSSNYCLIAAPLSPQVC